jgi:PAS domain-containing protein
MFGYPAADAGGHPFGELLPFEMAGGDEAERLAAVAHGQVWRGEGSIRLPDGRRLAAAAQLAAGDHAGPTGVPQPRAFFTRTAIRSSSAGVNSIRA